MTWTNQEEEGEDRGRIMMMPPKWLPCVTKNFPNVSFGGYGYMFLFLCPIHGHCYGFHLISRGEGRKDAFSVMYKYMETPPQRDIL